MKTKLYLHFGPGANPQTDTHFIKDQKIDFWQQPYAKEEDSYIEFLINSAQEKVLQMYNDSNGKIEIIAHSFGAFIVLNFDEETKSKISNYKLMAPTYNFYRSILYMIKHVSSVNKFTETLDLANELESDLSVDKFWNLFGVFSQKFPDYFKYYFKDEEDFKKYFEIAATKDQMDENTLIKAVSELVALYNKNLDEFNKLDNAKVYIGKDDPLIPQNEYIYFESFFGKENIQYIESGHFPQVELKQPLF